MNTRAAFFVSIFVLVGAAGARGQSHAFSDWRGLWVTRYDYRAGNADTVRRIVEDAAGLGVTDLLFQVRGSADAYYDSQFEPRAASLRRGWDPLAVAVESAHAHGMKLHAWINAMPLWTGETPPSTTTSIPHPYYSADPDYKLYRLDGTTPALNPSYVTANPVSGAWHAHVASVAADIVANYDVDGLHLDYIRWLGSTTWSELPHDDASHALFTQTTGLPAISRYAENYRFFVRDRITDLVTSVRNSVKAADPNATLSAAVWRDPDVGAREVLQDYRTWMEQDLLDVAVPMIYLSPSNHQLFDPNLENVLSIDTNARVAPGLGVYLHDDPEFTLTQLESLVDHHTGGVTLFAYSSFFTSGQLGQDRQLAVKSYLDSLLPSLSGDYNRNGVVEQADLDLVLLNWGSPAEPVPSGWTGDLPTGNVDQDELDKVLLNWGSGLAAAVATAAAVPEPSALAILLVATFVAVSVHPLLRLRRRSTYSKNWLHGLPRFR